MSSICGVRRCPSLSRRSGWTEVPGRHPGASDRSSGDLRERGSAEEAFRGRVCDQRTGAPRVKPGPAARRGRVRTSSRPLRPRLQHPPGQNDPAREGAQAETTKIRRLSVAPHPEKLAAVRRQAAEPATTPRKIATDAGMPAPIVGIVSALKTYLKTLRTAPGT